MHEPRACLLTTHWASMRDVFMACLTHDHRFALVGCHEHHPPGFLPPPFHMEVFQGVDMMHLAFLYGTTVLTGIRQESLLQL
jgi:hypothetical protein